MGGTYKQQRKVGGSPMYREQRRVGVAPIGNRDGRGAPSDAKQKHVFFKPSSKNPFFYNLYKVKNISILWSAYSVIHIIYCITEAVKHYMNFIYIDSGANNFIIFISKI